MTTEQTKEALTQTERRKKRSVTVYLSVLFAVAFLLLLLAYFMQQRNNEVALNDLTAANTLSRNELIAENEALRGDLAELEKQLEQSQAEARQASAQAETARQEGRQEGQQALQAQIDALLLLEKLEYLVSTQQHEPAAQLWDPALEALLPALDRPENYKPGQLTLAERVEALKLTLFPDYAP